MTPAVETAGLTKRYGRRVALDRCTLSIPTGKVVGLVGRTAPARRSSCT